MRHLLTATLLVVTSLASAQIVNIPDPVFKAWLVNQASINTNGDGEIQLSEALATDSIRRSGQNLPTIYDLTGIRSFSNLKYFLGNHIEAPDLDFSGMSALLRIFIESSAVVHATLNISGCNNLKFLETSHLLPSLDLTAFQELKWVEISLTNNASFNADGLPNLEFVSIGSMSTEHLRNISVKNCDSLHEFRFGGNADTINLSNTPQLDVLYAIPVNDLKAVICRNSGVRNLTIIRDPNGVDLVGTMDITGCPNLYHVSLYHFRPPTLDFSNHPNLQLLMLKYLDMANTMINLKNGTALTQLIYTAPGSARICADDFEIASLNAQIMPTATGNIIISPFCTLLPGGNYNLIRGKVRVDANTNGCDDNDFGVGNIPVRMTDNGNGQMITVSTNIAGNYAHYPYAGDFSLTAYLAYPNFSIAQANTNVSFDTANNLIDTTDFCITPNGIHNNLEITLLPVTAAKPGFAAHYMLTYKSRSTTVMSGDIQLNFDDGRMDLNYSSLPANTQSTGQLVWNYSNLHPFETRTIEVVFTLLPPPINNVGDTIYYLVQINPVGADETPADNSFILPQRLTGSYDPNDKQCLQGSKIDITAIDNDLHYLVRFQNTGTDTAFNVVVTDTLSTNLDWSSFDFIGSSHTVTVIQKDNKLEFDFADIKLPYSAINEPGSHGYLAYKIKPKNTVAAGDSLNNKASIWFDFNLPVVTNTATTVVSSQSAPLVKLDFFLLSSKDEGYLLAWKVTTAAFITTFGIEKSSDGIHFNNIGNITANAQRCQLPFNFTDDNPLNGKNYYRIKITDANGISFYSKVLVMRKTKSEFEINAVVSNQDNTILYLNVLKDQTVQMKIIGADGRLVYSQSKMIVAGTNTLNLQTGNLPKGIYTLVGYTNDGGIVTKRFIK